MARPKKCRKVCSLPENMEFRPAAANENLSEVVMTVDEYETIRLIDKEGFSQEECGAYMNIARTTVQFIYTSARKKLADALVESRVLRIEGGDYRLCDGSEDYCGCGGCRRHKKCSDIKANHSDVGGEGMKVIIPVDEDRKTVCQSFARAPYFMIYNTDFKKAITLENTAAQAEGGAGLKAAQLVVDSGAAALITVRCGENAAEVFKAAEIKIYKADGADALENAKAFEENKLEELTHFHAGYHGLK